MRTLRKLDEANFFLNLLEANYNEDPEFDYFLSAFISSSRSILWIMRAEYCDIKEWESWFNSLNPSQSEKEFLKKVNNIRVMSEKTDPIISKVRMNVDIPNEAFTEEINEHLKRLDKKNVTVAIEVIEESDSQSYGVIDQNTVRLKGKVNGVFRRLDDFPDSNILDICKDYYCKLKNIVDECLKKFASEVYVNDTGRLSIKMNKIED